VLPLNAGPWHESERWVGIVSGVVLVAVFWRSGAIGLGAAVCLAVAVVLLQSVLWRRMRRRD
jgi:hypothetical protein